MGVHDGHRKRMKARFRERGPDELRDHELLELLLFYAIPRQDTNEIARRLLDRFGSFAAVMEATPEELREISEQQLRWFAKRFIRSLCGNSLFAKTNFL